MPADALRHEPQFVVLLVQVLVHILICRVSRLWGIYSFCWLSLSLFSPALFRLAAEPDSSSKTPTEISTTFLAHFFPLVSTLIANWCALSATFCDFSAANNPNLQNFSILVSLALNSVLINAFRFKWTCRRLVTMKKSLVPTFKILFCSLRVFINYQTMDIGSFGYNVALQQTSRR